MVARDYKFMCSDPGQDMIQKDIRELGLNRVVVASERSMPTSCIALTTSGCTRVPGSVPADMARAFAGSASALNQAAAICDRPAL